MSHVTRPLAWAMAAAALAAAVVAVVVVAVAAGRGIPDVPSAWEMLPLVVGVGAPACVGLVLVLRRPGTRGGQDPRSGVRRGGGRGGGDDR